MSHELVKIGRYEVTAELGRGSMGVVHRAYDPVMGRDVAVKSVLLPRGLPEERKDEFHRRFLREVRAASRLSHPGIVTIYDCDEESEAELPYIAMEYVEGMTLHELIQYEGALSPEWVFTAADNLAAGLYSAHQAGVVHRDLKPANILVRESDGVAKIADFGVARINISDLTDEGTTYGSPAYIAPERIKGQTADARSDLFSLAVVLYEALSGNRPFGGYDFASTCYSILSEPPVSIRRHETDLSPAFDGFFQRALAKDPDERFQNGEAFRHAFLALRDQQASFAVGATATLTMPEPIAEAEHQATEETESTACLEPEGIDDAVGPTHGTNTDAENHAYATQRIEVAIDREIERRLSEVRPAQPISPRLLIVGAAVALLAALIGIAMTSG